MLRIHPRTLLVLVVLVFFTGAITAGVVIGMVMEDFHFLAAATALGFPALVAWAALGYNSINNNLSTPKDPNE